MEGGCLGGGLDATSFMLQEPHSLLNDSLQGAAQREAQVEEAQRLRHQRHVAALRHLTGQVMAALGRMEEGTCGRCDALGRDILKGELNREPATTLCSPCRGHDARSDQDAAVSPLAPGLLMRQQRHL